jgi:ADP-ribose pyrophosphatase YjhB (NUDIX family)
MKKGKDYIGVGGGCLIMNDKNKVLLIRRAGEVRNEAGYWSKPGGAVGFGEKVADAMIREMKEELDIEVEIIGMLPHTDHIITKQTNKDEQHWVAFNLIAKITRGELKNMEPHKCDKVGWFPMDKLPEKITQTTKEPVENYLAGRFVTISN